MNKNIEQKLKRLIKETINEVILGNGESFTPYTPQERERNFQGLTQMGNPSYDAFMKWKRRELEKGRPNKELGWATYLKERYNEQL